MTIKNKILFATAFAGGTALLVSNYLFRFNLKNAIIPEGFTLTAHTGCEGTKDNSLDAITLGFGCGADIVEIDLDDFGIDGTGELTYAAGGYEPLFSNSDNTIFRIIGLVLGLNNFEWAVAPFDERSMHKYNGSTYEMDNNYNPNEMEGSTTYTLPYWMGRYHGMLG